MALLHLCRSARMKRKLLGIHNLRRDCGWKLNEQNTAFEAAASDNESSASQVTIRPASLDDLGAMVAIWNDGQISQGHKPIEHEQAICIFRKRVSAFTNATVIQSPREVAVPYPRGGRDKRHNDAESSRVPRTLRSNMLHRSSTKSSDPIERFPG
jgi:hypothetical protein